MDIEGKTIWQQAAGEHPRDYSGVCLKWGVILNGPGWAGKWPECAAALREDGITSKKITDLRRFSEQMQDGDLVVLRTGTSKVFGVGMVIGGYEWRHEFGDIDGWDLQHIRRVRWLWNGSAQPQNFNPYDMKLGDTTQLLDSEPVKQWIAGLQIAPELYTAPLIELPKRSSEAELSMEEISDFLFDEGVASASITHLLQEIGELRRIAKWYQRSLSDQKGPSEHETVAYLVVPLLRALGWTPQRMAVEWNRVDVALFEKLPRQDATLQAVVEAKLLKSSCLSAYSQALDYSKGKSSCHRLIVTDGTRYGVYIRDQTEEFRLFAYLNLAELMQDYPIYSCKGAKDALLAMTPEWKFATSLPPSA